MDHGRSQRNRPEICRTSNGERTEKQKTISTILLCLSDWERERTKRIKIATEKIGKSDEESGQPTTS